MSEPHFDLRTGVRNPDIVAQCVAEAGYGTCVGDPETEECLYEAYGTVIEVVSNAEYWSQYGAMSDALAKDFDLSCTFDNFCLTVTKDGRRHAQKWDKR